MDESSRLAELRSKNPLTEAELRELDRLSGRALRAFPSPYELGVSLENSEVLRENLTTLERKRIQARRNGYALEVIAIDTYRLEFLLVAWLVRHARRRISLAEGTFGWTKRRRSDPTPPGGTEGL